MERKNPFHELYVTETIQSEDFVKLFSPFLVKYATALFQPGNVVLKGVQGSGKSMLLNLLKPEIRLAYERAGKEFPIPKRCMNFIGAGINISRSGAVDFGQRPFDSKKNDEHDVLPLYFADFLNYWIVADILTSIEILTADINLGIAGKMGIKRVSSMMNKFSCLLAKDDCWFGYLSDVNDYDSLKNKLSQRITTYRSYLGYNIETFPEEIKHSKTRIGEPISRTAEQLWRIGITPQNVPIFVRIDQYEVLHSMEGLREYGPVYRQMINKAISSRDPRVSYRIGTRHYAWDTDLHVYGVGSKLEVERDYKEVDLDLILRRQEDRKTWIFPDFAQSVFDRRIEYAEYKKTGENTDLIKEVFGHGLSPDVEAKKYAKTSAERVINKDGRLSKESFDFLTTLAEKDPLSAKLGDAWARQKGKGGIVWKNLKEPYPWEKQIYWRKERIQQALMQIAARCAQRKIWAGRDDILALSGGNILVFVSLCQHIWEAWMRHTQGPGYIDNAIPEIESSLQAVGIQEASNHWYHKISEEAGGDRRQRFIRYLGKMFYKELINDKSMSYPGHNGFSVTIDEFQSDTRVSIFLHEAVDYGDLFDSPHTTKSPDRKQRYKWYLNPVLSPYFKIPVSHTKEPIYVTIQDIRKWLILSGAIDDTPLFSTKK